MAERFNPPGGDMRYGYVPFGRLQSADRVSVKTNRYPHGVEHLPDEEYHYPVKKDGRLANARRWISLERATELYNEHMVQEIMDR